MFFVKYLSSDLRYLIHNCRVGCIFDKNSATDEAKLLVHYKRFCSLFSWLLPQKFKTVNDATLFMEHAKYGKGMAFEDVPNATKFYN